MPAGFPFLAPRKRYRGNWRKTASGESPCSGATFYQAFARSWRTGQMRSCDRDEYTEKIHANYRRSIFSCNYFGSERRAKRSSSYRSRCITNCNCYCSFVESSDSRWISFYRHNRCIHKYVSFSQLLYSFFWNSNKLKLFNYIAKSKNIFLVQSR